jgi:S-disulfanyl-L-cysteine oxidoreductase SoxD
MFNFLEYQYITSEVKYKTSGRRGRKGFAEDAKEDGEKTNTQNFKFRKHFVYHLALNICSIVLWHLKSFLYSFGIFFFASSAQLLRPLRPAVRYSALAALLTLPTLTPAQSKFDGIGRTATPAEVKAWDIDVRPDFKGLPKGQGSVAQGEKLWEAQCASCHGSFGESNEVFTPLAGYTNAKDVQSGKVASLQLDGAAPTRTSMMKVSQLSTLWDYINRAMPWTAPKSLKPDEVYALTAYLLNLGEVMPADFTLSDKNMAETQKRLPNRAGKTTAHSLWPGKEFGGTPKPDVQGSSCTVNCATEPKVASLIPDYARNAHGNLADQSRALGGLRGAETGKSSISKPNQALAQSNIAGAATKNVVSAEANASAVQNSDVMPIMQKYACMACHAVDTKLVGPSFKEVAAKQGARPDAQAYVAGKIKAGGAGVYGQIPMPAQSISPEDAQLVARWLLQGAQK